MDQAVRLATVAENLHYQVNTYKSDYLVENGSRKASGNVYLNINCLGAGDCGLVDLSIKPCILDSAYSVGLVTQPSRESSHS